LFASTNLAANFRECLARLHCVVRVDVPSAAPMRAKE
jgi:hypothetical protein